MIELFVPGRLCLFGEHSDWAGAYRQENPEIERGAAIVTGIDQGIYARAEKSDKFRFRTKRNDGSVTDWMEYEFSGDVLREVAKSGEFFSYVAGVAAYMLDSYNVGGISVDCYEVTLPIQKGLASSAAICVLIARAFNQLYQLQLSVRDEMEAAYQGECMTPSQCGRLDQACAFGSEPVRLEFDAEELKVRRLGVGKDLYWVFCDLHGAKNTKKILSSLNACYPYAQNETAQNVQKALGRENRRIVREMVKAIEKGDAAGIGQMMYEAQKIFDTMVAPACPSELASPLLHQIMEDENVRRLALGVKGVGSQGDGSAQMICADEAHQLALIEYLKKELSLTAYSFCVRTQHAVHKAVIPLAGFGTRLFPATKVLDKAFFPVFDYDGNIKPTLLVILEELVRAGIEEIALIIRPGEQARFERLFREDAKEGWFGKLPDAMKQYDETVRQIGARVTYIYQEEQHGFGHAVYQAEEFAGGEPVLMMLGDHVYHSVTGVSCAAQLIRAYERTGVMTIGLDEVELSRVGRYGILAGDFVDEDERLMQVKTMVEKPTAAYAEEHLGVRRGGEKKYYCVFGQYILTPKVFRLLGRNVKAYDGEGEIELTGVLDEIRATDGMNGYLINGKRFDIGEPEEYRKTILTFGKGAEGRKEEYKWRY